jgi:putative DNA primase/helicase
MKPQRNFDELYEAPRRKQPEVELIGNLGTDNSLVLNPHNTLLERILKRDILYETDSINAEDWKEYHQGTFIFNHTNSSWYTWNHINWQQDTKGEAIESVKEFANWLWQNTQRKKMPATAHELNRIIKISKKLSNMKGIESCLTAAQSIPSISYEENHFDANPDLLNFNNGTYDLSTHEFREHSKDDLITRSLSFSYNAKSTNKTNFERFLEQIFQDDKDLIRFVIECLAMCLSGRITEQVFQFWYGTGANGKSVLANTIMELLSCYSRKIEFSILQDTSSNADKSQQEKTRLKGTRMAIASEVGEGKYLNEQLIKDLTSNDMQTARELYSKTYEFIPTHHLIIIGNHKPRIRGTDDGIKRRVLLIPFLYTVPKDKQMPQDKLLEQYRLEFPAIMNTLIESYKTIQNNNGKFTSIPDIVLTHTNDYFMEMDIIANWINDCCLLSPRYDTSAKDLYSCYSGWMKENGNHPLGNSSFSRKLQEHITTNSLEIKVCRSTGNRLRFQGIGILTDENETDKNLK